jgi:hypothetical protein
MYTVAGKLAYSASIKIQSAGFVNLLLMISISQNEKIFLVKPTAYL